MLVRARIPGLSKIRCPGCSGKRLRSRVTRRVEAGSSAVGSSEVDGSGESIGGGTVERITLGQTVPFWFAGSNLSNPVT